MATKSDYYTHVMDIPPQYGPGFSLPESKLIASKIDGTDGSWNLPLPSFNPSVDIEPVHPDIDPGAEASKHEAAYKILKNYENIIKFSLRGAGQPGAKQFQAPLADPYAVPALEYYDDFSILMKILVQCLLGDYKQVQSLPIINRNASTKNKLISSLEYLRDRIGVPRDMSYPAARQLRAHINYITSLLNSA
jgi:glutathione S-transferase